MRTLFRNIAQLVQPLPHEDGDAPLEIVRDAFILVEDGVIGATGQDTAESSTAGRAAGANTADGSAGHAAALPAADVVVDLAGHVVLPGLVDSHTHAVFAGARMADMARRARGATYATIAAAGGGIHDSVAALHAASEAELVQASLPRLRRMWARGTTTVEVKSGYGLTLEEERKHLRAIAAVRAQVPQDVRPTLLAHTLPRPAPQDPAAHLAALEALIAETAHAALARHLDVFVEGGAFTQAQARRLAAAGKRAGLPLKLHVDQLASGGGAQLAAELGALSADHLEHTDAAGAAALAAAGVVATVLPGCRMFLGHGPWPDGRALRAAGCQVAIATDCNPGSAMVHDLLLCATLAATQCGLTLEEALWGVTRGGALALGLTDRGTLRPGERADFVVLEGDDWRAALYYPGEAPIAAVAIAGQLEDVPRREAAWRAPTA